MTAGGQRHADRTARGDRDRDGRGAAASPGPRGCWLGAGSRRQAGEVRLKAQGPEDAGWELGAGGRQAATPGASGGAWP